LHRRSRFGLPTARRVTRLSGRGKRGLRPPDTFPINIRPRAIRRFRLTGLEHPRKRQTGRKAGRKAMGHRAARLGDCTLRRDVGAEPSCGYRWNTLKVEDGPGVVTVNQVIAGRSQAPAITLAWRSGSIRKRSRQRTRLRVRKLGALARRAIKRCYAVSAVFGW